MKLKQSNNMSGFLNSIVRGAGMSIGRNLVGDFGRSKKSTTTSNRYYDRAENEMEKSLNFPIKGKSDTILGNCFNMYQAFDDECKYFKGTIAIMISPAKSKYYSQSHEKLKDCIEYLEFKDSTDKNIVKLEELKSKINISFCAFITNLSKSMLNLESKKDKETARIWWFESEGGRDGIKTLVSQLPNTDTLIAQVEEHINPKSFFSKLFK
jgi:hypothetical protein